MRLSPVLLCLWTVITVAPVRAQFEYGEILGTIRDASGAVLLHAKVTVHGLDTNVQASTLTNDQGNYSFPDLRSGKYEVTAAVTGFRPAKRDALTLRVGDRLRTDMTLQPDLITGEVTVEASVAPLLEPDTSTRGQVIQSQQIEELPLNKRDYTQLVLLVPGSTYNPDQRLGGAISINCNRTLQNDYLLDGIDNNSHATSFRGDRVDVMLPSGDAVAEFRVKRNGHTAQNVHTAAAQANAHSK